MAILKPRKRPCSSCPYRRDVPPGIWAPGEYEKLAAYDGTTGEQAEKGAFGVFMCHQADGRLCSGWVACHDMEENLAIRMDGDVDVAAARAYTTDVPVFSSGTEAAAHGLAGVDDPSPEATAAIKKLTEVRRRRGKPVNYK